jgi:hypothetical protein
MKFNLRSLPSWPLSLAVAFFLIPVVLAVTYPSSFWIGTDYETLGLADALNLAYRLADGKMYVATGMAYHPGVPFYVMSWLALALAGYPIASADSGFYAAVIADVERYHQITIWLNALAGAIGVYIFARTARKLAPVAVVVTGLGLWLISTPATLLAFASPSIDSFAVLINGLFFVVLVRLAFDRDVPLSVAAFAASVGVLGYLNKLSYIYIGLTLAVTGILNLAFRRPGWIRSGVFCILFGAAFFLVVKTTGLAIIGREAFDSLMEYHKQVILGSGMYGTGPEVVVSRDEVWRAIAAIPVEKSYAIALALIGGALLAVAGFVTALRGAQHIPIGILGIGVGLASAMSAAIVLKHYALHYTAGVSATLPASLVVGYLLVRDWGYRPRPIAGVVTAMAAAVAVIFMATQTIPPVTAILASRMVATERVKADLADIHMHLAGEKRVVEYVYKAPLAEYGEGFVVSYASVPRLTEAYLKSRPNVISSMTVGLIDREVGAFVLDKGYFPTAASIKAAPNIALLAAKPVTMADGDKLIELRMVWLLIRN